MGIFKKDKPRYYEDMAETRFQQVLELVKDLDRKEFNKLIEATKLAWQGYDKMRQVQTIDEKEEADIKDAEKRLDFIEEGK